MWDGMVTFLLAESMAIKHSAMLHPDIPSITKSNPKDIVHTMMLRETEWFKYVQGKSSEPVPEKLGQHNNSISLERPVYSVRSLLLPAISVPFYYAGLAFGISPLIVVTFFANSIIIALTSLIVFCFSLEIYTSKKISFILSLLFCVGSFVLPYNSTFFPQPLQALLLITSAFFLHKSSHLTIISSIHNKKDYEARREDNMRYDIHKRKNNKAMYFAVLSGILLGLSVFAHPTSLIVIPGFIIYSIISFKRYKNKKSLGLFLVSLVIILFFMSLVNYWRFGAFTEFGYGGYYDQLKRTWPGLVGLLVSPGKGLLFYFPVVILLPLALGLMYKMKKERLLTVLIIYIIVINWAYIGTLDAENPNKSVLWSGAIAWGPRYLVPVMPFIILPFGTLLTGFRQRQRLLKIGFATLCITGIIVNLSGKLVWSDYVFTYALYKEQLYKVDHRADEMTWNPYYSPIVLHMKLLLYDSNYISNLPVDKYRYSLNHYYLSFGLAPCTYDLYIFCKFGIVPILILSTVNVFLATLILKESPITSFRNPLRYLRSL